MSPGWAYDMNNPNAPTGNQVYDYNPMLMPNYQTQNQPVTSYVPDDQLQNFKPTNRNMSFDINGENVANLIISGTNTFASLLEKGENSRRQSQLSNLMNADNVFAVNPAGSASRGDYEVNSGDFRPNKKVPIQFQGFNTGRVGSGMYKNGGAYRAGQEIEMTDDELKQFLAAGGQVEYLK
jgi:hypothetical protein